MALFGWVQEYQANAPGVLTDSANPVVNGQPFNVKGSAKSIALEATPTPYDLVSDPMTLVDINGNTVEYEQRRWTIIIKDDGGGTVDTSANTPDPYGAPTVAATHSEDVSDALRSIDPASGDEGKFLNEKGGFSEPGGGRLFVKVEELSPSPSFISNTFLPIPGLTWTATEDITNAICYARVNHDPRDELQFQVAVFIDGTLVSGSTVTPYQKKKKDNSFDILYPITFTTGQVIDIRLDLDNDESDLSARYMTIWQI